MSSVIKHSGNVVHYTLGFLMVNNQVLLGRRSTGIGKGLWCDYGKNQWTGFGGHREISETDEDCIIREFEEECGVIIKKPQLVGYLKTFYKNDINTRVVSVYKIVTANTEKMRVTSEMPEIEWFPISQLPHPEMLNSYKRWFPNVINSKPFTAFIHHDIYPPKERIRVTHSCHL